MKIVNFSMMLYVGLMGQVIACQAIAQSIQNPFVPPVLETVDENGINTITGIPSRTISSANIGSGPSLLLRSVSYNTTNAQDNYFGRMCFGCQPGAIGYIFGPGLSKQIRGGGIFYPYDGGFYAGNVTYDPVPPTHYSEYIDKYGDIYSYRHNKYTDQGTLRKITRANGEIININYIDKSSFIYVSNNYGYMLKNVASNIVSGYQNTVTMPINLSENYCNSNTLPECQGVESSRAITSTTQFGTDQYMWAFTQEIVHNPYGGSSSISLTSEWSSVGRSKTFNADSVYFDYGSNDSDEPNCKNKTGFCLSEGSFRVVIGNRTTYYSIDYGPKTAWTINSSKTGITSYTCTYGTTLTRTNSDGGKYLITSCGGYDAVPIITSIEFRPGDGQPTRFTRYAYNENQDLTWVGYPEGNATYFVYDGRANVIERGEVPKSGGTPRVWTAGYSSNCPSPKTCNKPLWTKDAKGQQTDFEYSTVHGGVTLERLPPDANGMRKETHYEYTPLYAKIKDASGNLVNAEGPIYKLTKVWTCATAASCAGSVNEQVREYAYNHNNLLMTSETVRSGDNSVSATTSYTYDYVGNVTSVDGPRTDVDDRSYTTWDVLRRKVFEVGPDPDGAGPLKRQIVKHYYDADSLDIRTEVGTGNNADGSDFVWSSAKRMTYDGAAQLIKTEVVVP